MCDVMEEARCCWGSREVAGRAAGGMAPVPCCRCAHKRRASPLACLAVCFLVLLYNLLGGFLFLALEGGASAPASTSPAAPSDDTAVAASKPNLSQPRAGTDLRSRTVERLWSITEDLNILYKENWTKLAAKELMDFQKVLIKTMRGGGGAGVSGAEGAAAAEGRLGYQPDADYRWTFAGSFLYALTLITTIGHGNVTPRSPAGKVAAVCYACVGIPIIMLYLSTLGEALARNFRALYSRLCPARLATDAFHSRADCLASPAPRDKLCAERQRRTPFQAALNLDSFGGGYHWTCRDHTRVPPPLSALLVVLYVALGTLVFHATEKWDFMDGCYFSFSSLATVGFGDLRPGLYASTVSANAEDVAVGVCCIYILVGIVVVAMCFNLIQEDMSGVVRGVSALCAGGGKARAVHSAERPRDDKAAMSVLS
ncbi:TWiK family of potassium channels protein 18 [Manduca sexta]|uniref:Potassium channel domain-containing protein n=1 Tax=Manduca sexta TaxID=7130 RepID=A0A921Z0G4_MANSE|nr:TWiK family of potassium channels protein 18 [Manduca sexta]XP_030023294.1 TWiK family of potassium channels protein 18 [Manduca sexta]XP_037292513.1 TWiK family of potassium channels protein 18 [Manduca sexta]KAG6448449.1 hypothetical protein O3G_MSEX005474 [Manduca sexta]KAG6448450.1 hypothetical protein O3G_MSEX005474 [Manduca sexta]